ncbi:hypothetical protein LPJ66_003968 [Kickxella alabastrina]|uniref:Uncharacterized protein n=1 Tax=Kickxella alabastrina TaxID=61397 RepID=A0ACC1IMB3_9FUNG|nr:hypothetical protein LPJ66_003968 [Kickxella alabastrina]
MVNNQYAPPTLPTHSQAPQNQYYNGGQQYPPQQFNDQNQQEPRPQVVYVHQPQTNTPQLRGGGAGALYLGVDEGISERCLGMVEVDVVEYLAGVDVGVVEYLCVVEVVLGLVDEVVLMVEYFELEVGLGLVKSKVWR